MSTRVRHCIECPKCRTRYLIGFSPYSNGSYLVASGSRAHEEWVLYCSCQSPVASSRWTWDELTTYRVSSQAYRRKYGFPDEITPLAGSERAPSSLPQALKSSWPRRIRIRVGRAQE